MNYHISLEIEFRKNPYSGLYIAIEGIDGCGKTTQVQKLQEYFIKHKRTVETTSEPRVTLPGGEIIMDVFLSKVKMPPVAFQHFLTSNRLMNQAQIVIPALERGDVVISDRSFWSALPYGLMDREVGYSQKEAELMLVSQSLLSHYYQSIVPDMTFYIDIDASVALERIAARKGRKDIYDKKEKLETVVRGYRFLTKTYPEAFIIIDGKKSIDEITREMIEIVESKLPK